MEFTELVSAFLKEDNTNSFLGSNVWLLSWPYHVTGHMYANLSLFTFRRVVRKRITEHAIMLGEMFLLKAHIMFCFFFLLQN